MNHKILGMVLFTSFVGGLFAAVDTSMSKDELRNYEEKKAGWTPLAWQTDKNFMAAAFDRRDELVPTEFDKNGNVTKNALIKVLKVRNAKDTKFGMMAEAKVSWDGIKSEVDKKFSEIKKLGKYRMTEKTNPTNNPILTKRYQDRIRLNNEYDELIQRLYEIYKAAITPQVAAAK